MLFSTCGGSDREAGAASRNCRSIWMNMQQRQQQATQKSAQHEPGMPYMSRTWRRCAARQQHQKRSKVVNVAVHVTTKPMSLQGELPHEASQPGSDT